MAERTNSELFTKSSLKLQSGSFIIQSGIQDTMDDTVEATTGSVSPIGETGVYKGHTMKTYNLPVVGVEIKLSKPIGE